MPAAPVVTHRVVDRGDPRARDPGSTGAKLADPSVNPASWLANGNFTPI